MATTEALRYTESDLDRSCESARADTFQRVKEWMMLQGSAGKGLAEQLNYIKLNDMQALLTAKNALEAARNRYALEVAAFKKKYPAATEELT